MNINKIMRELAEYTRLAEELNATIDSLKDQLKEYMRASGVDTLTGTEHKATMKPVTTSRIDSAALKRDQPEIAAAYTVKTTVSRFTFM